MNRMKLNCSSMGELLLVNQTVNALRRFEEVIREFQSLK